MNNHMNKVSNIIVQGILGVGIAVLFSFIWAVMSCLSDTLTLMQLSPPSNLIRGFGHWMTITVPLFSVVGMLRAMVKDFLS